MCWIYALLCVASAHGAALTGGDRMTTDVYDSIDYAKVTFVEKELYVPPLDEIKEVLSSGLKSNFESVEVSVVDCPDLTQPPYHLTTRGLNGRPRLVEIGSPAYLLPLVQRDKIYDLKTLVQHLGMSTAFVGGAGAGPWPVLGVNCEGIVNLHVKDGEVDQGSRIVSIVPVGAPKGSSGYHQQQLPNNETRSALLGNYLVCEGTQEKVIKVVAKKRSGPDSFSGAIRESLRQHYGDQTVGLGGMFLLREGRAKFHVMPDFPSAPVCSDAEVDEWLHYFEVKAPITILGTLVTGDMGLDLREKHFHGFSLHGDGGHYHYDTTPAAVEYEGYFVPAGSIIRIHQPVETHMMGRD